MVHPPVTHRSPRLGKLVARGLVLLLAAGLATACGPSSDERAAQEQSAARQAKWQEIQQKKAQLDAKRTELQAARQRAVAEPAADGAAATAEPAAEGAPTATPADVGTLENDLQELADALNTDLVGYINEDPPIAGQPMTDEQTRAIRMKSDIDMMFARDYIDKGGDYEQAISIYQSALAVDPDNPDLQRALDTAQRERYMDEERFSQVKKGMTEEQVATAIGRPNLHNVRDYPKEVVAWFYPKSPQRDAAAVWFRPTDGRLTVYKVDFNALAGNAAGGG